MLTPPNSTSLTDLENEVRNQMLFNNKEMADLIENKGDNKHTSLKLNLQHCHACKQ
jgi:hypothetical protein